VAEMVLPDIDLESRVVIVTGADRTGKGGQLNLTPLSVLT